MKVVLVVVRALGTILKVLGKYLDKMATGDRAFSVAAPRL